MCSKGKWNTRAHDDLWSSFVKNHTVKKSSELGKPIRQQLQEYLGGEHQEFHLPFELEVRKIRIA